MGTFDRTVLRSVFIGDILLIGNDCSKRHDWLLGRVVKLLPAIASVVLFVPGKTAQRLFALECANDKSICHAEPIWKPQN